MLTLCPAAEEGDVYVPEVQMLKMEMEMCIRQKSARYRAWFLLINTKKWHLDIWKRLVIHLKKISNLDIWKRLVIHLKKISKTLVKHLKWAYLVNRNKLHNGNIWEHSTFIILHFTFYIPLTIGFGTIFSMDSKVISTIWSKSVVGSVRNTIGLRDVQFTFFI